MINFGKSGGSGSGGSGSDGGGSGSDWKIGASTSLLRSRDGMTRKWAVQTLTRFCVVSEYKEKFDLIN